jgi:hypothetical protein
MWRGPSWDAIADQAAGDDGLAIAGKVVARADMQTKKKAANGRLAASGVPEKAT